MIFIETGELDQEDWARSEFYPRTGQVRIMKKERLKAGRLITNQWDYNLRTSSLWTPHGSTTTEADTKILFEALDALTKNGANLDAVPKGYPEIQKIVLETRQQPPVSMDSLQQGSFYLVVDKNSERLHVYQHDETQKKELSGGDRIWIGICPQLHPAFGGHRYLEISNYSGEPSKPISPNYAWSKSYHFREFTGNTELDVEFFSVLPKDIETIAELRPSDSDPFVELELNRKQICIQTAVRALQYERWGKQEDTLSKKRYEGVTRENYKKALEILISRFGTELFVKEILFIMSEQLELLHTSKHSPGLQYRPHSDTSPQRAEMMELAKQVILNTHPTPENMRDSGIIVNIVPLFGDADFWQILRTSHIELFNQFVDYLQSLPKDYLQQKSPYAKAKIDPVALIKQYFPESYKEIIISRPDFTSDTLEAIQILSYTQ